MYSIDFVSAILGYVIGVALCYTTMKMVYELESYDNDE
jgi:hypothetical protein